MKYVGVIKNARVNKKFNFVVKQGSEIYFLRGDIILLSFLSLPFSFLIFQSLSRFNKLLTELLIYVIKYRCNFSFLKDAYISIEDVYRETRNWSEGVLI